jgi:uncharacterized protein
VLRGSPSIITCPGHLGGTDAPDNLALACRRWRELCVTSTRHEYSPLFFVSDSWYHVSIVAPMIVLPGNQGGWSCQPAPEPYTGRIGHVPEPSRYQPSQEHPHTFAIGIHDVRTGPPYEGELGEGLLLRTDRGDIQTILHQAPEAQYGVIWVGGARGGFGRPAQGAYARLADALRRERISSLRLSYRHPNVLPECALDVLAGVAYLTHGGVQHVVLVGHSFGGAVVIIAGALHARVAGVVALAPQTYGAQVAGQLTPRPLLVVHGKADTRLPYTCGVQIYQWAQEPKQLVLYEGAEHRLDECAEALDQLLTQWIPTSLRAAV